MSDTAVASWPGMPENWLFQLMASETRPVPCDASWVNGWVRAWICPMVASLMCWNWSLSCVSWLTMVVIWVTWLVVCVSWFAIITRR